MNKPEETNINPVEAEALDFLIAAEFDPTAIERMPEHLRANARRFLAELQTINSYPVEPPSDALIDATLARIAQEERRQSQRMSFSNSQPSLRKRLGIPNIVAVAAMLIVAAGVAVPLTNQVRQSQSQLLCSNGLKTLGSGLSAYAADNRGVLPMTAGLGSFLTDSTSNESGIIENAQHLDILAKNGYCDAKCTRCNGSRSLSYRIPMHHSQKNLSSMQRSPVAADANPVQAMVRRGVMPVNFSISSQNHAQRGQNVLFSDGSVIWMVTPNLSNGPKGLFNNIWVIRDKNGIETFNLRANPRHALEIFLAN